MTRFIPLSVMVAAVGCGGSKPIPTAPKPLTVAEWKTLPATEKYTADSLERLKAGDPALQTPEGWDRFAKTDLAAARRKDKAAGTRP